MLKYILGIIFILGLFFSFTFRAVPGNPDQGTILNELRQPGKNFESSQERARFSLVKSIADDRSFILDKYAEESLPDIAYKSGHYYSVFLPGLSALAIPFYIAGKYLNQPIIMTFLLPALLSILASIIVFLFSKKLGQSSLAATLSAIVFGLCTVTWSYSITFYAHTLSALCVIGSLFFAYRAKNGSDWNFLFFWLLFGIGILTDYPNALIILPALLFVVGESLKINALTFRDRKYNLINIRLGLFYSVIAFLILIAALFLYNTATFGSWREIAHNYRVTELITTIPNYHFLFSRIMDIKYIENGLYTLLLSKSRGIFVYSPIVILSFLGLYRLYYRKPKITMILALTFFANLMVYAAFYDPWGGWSYGPRYLIASMPVLALLTGESYDFIKSKTLYLIGFIVLFFSSFSIALLGALTSNLLPPYAEVGKQISFLSAFDFLKQSGSSSLILSQINDHFYLSGTEYYFLILIVFTIIFFPLFSYQIFRNVLNFLFGLRWPIFNIFRKRQNADAQN